MSLRAARLGHIFLLLGAPDEVLIARHRRLPNPHRSQEVMLETARTYRLGYREGWYTMMPPVRMHWVGQECPSEYVLQHICSTAKAETYRALQLPSAYSTGTLEPHQVLVVGDRVNPNSSVSDRRPFFTRQDGGTSGLLYWMLEEADLRPRDVHLCNAYSKTGVPLLRQALIDFLQPRIIIALGKSAATRLSSMRVPHHCLPHPSWILRFDRSNLNSHVETLRQIVGTA